MTEPLDGQAEHDRLASVLGDYLSRERAGEAPPLAEFLAQHPEQATGLAACLGALEQLAPHGSAAPLRQLGRHRLVRVIGRGGMGVVYEAEHIGLGRRVALKVLAPGALGDAERAARFRREVETTARLRHPGIVPVIEAGEDDGVPWYTMPLLSGRSLDVLLDDWRRAHGAPPLGPGADLATWLARFSAVARALHAAHLSGVVHRDVKPSNLLLDLDGVVWILDFGLASVATGIQGLTLGPLGTPRYMSPEQIAGRTVDARSDQFSLAATLYEVLTLRQAFAGDELQPVLRAIALREPRSPRAIVKRFPHDVEVVLQRALEKEPHRRYPDLAAFAADLDRFLAYEPVSARSVGTLGRWIRRARRRPGATGAASIAVLALALVAVQPVWRAWERQREAAGLEQEIEGLLARGAAAEALPLCGRLQALAPRSASTAALEERVRKSAALETERRARERDARRAAQLADAGRGRGEAWSLAGPAVLESGLRARALEGSIEPWAPLEETRELAAARASERALAAQREEDLRAAISSLVSALALDPDCAGARGELSRLSLAALLEAEQSGPDERAAEFERLARAYDDGAGARLLAGRGALSLASEPAGAEVRLYRFDTRGALRLPLPCDARGEFAPPVSAPFESAHEGAPDPAAGPWRRLRVERPDAAHPTIGEGDELLLVCGAPPEDAAWIRRHTAAGHATQANSAHFVDLRRDGSLLQVRLAPDAALDVAGEVVESAAFPRDAAATLRGTTPLALDDLARGSYLAELSAPGRASVRVPFEIGRCEREALAVELPAAARVPAGFAVVAAGRARLGGDSRALACWPRGEVELGSFAIELREVTFAQYFEFLRDLARTDPAAAERRGPRQGPQGATAPLWRRNGAGELEPLLPAEASPAWPVVCIGYDDALAFCEWRTARSGIDGLRFDLPTEAEWEKAARGADGRAFPWGDEFEWTLARLGRSGSISGLLAGGLYATDESVYGVRDLCGNVREWCRKEADGLWVVIRGGGWSNRIEGDCRAANRAHERAPQFTDTATGFRTVARWLPR